MIIFEAVFKKRSSRAQGAINDLLLTYDDEQDIAVGALKTLGEGQKLYFYVYGENEKRPEVK